MDEQNQELMNQDQEEQLPEHEPERKPTPQFSYTLRIIIGAYIAYLGWQLASGIISGSVTGTELIICGIAAAVFAVAGVGLVVWSVWLMMKKP